MSDQSTRRKANHKILSKEKPKEWNNIPIPVSEVLTEIVTSSNLQHQLNDSVDNQITDLINMSTLIYAYYEEHLANLPKKINEKLSIVHNRLESSIE